MALLVVPSVFALGCAGLAPMALSLGKNLLNASSANYSDAYAGSIDKLLKMLQKKTETETKTEAPADATDRTLPERALALEIALFRDGQPPIPIEDGEVMYDGAGDLEASDWIKISFSPNQSCYVYVVSIDATGWVTPVFPSVESSFGNPLPPGQTVQIPEGDRWYALDEHRGVETFYFLASRVRRADLESLLAEFARKVRPVGRGAYVPVEEPAVSTRGIVAVGPGQPTSVTSASGGTHQVSPTSFLADIDGMDLVVTRWFRHE